MRSATWQASTIQELQAWFEARAEVQAIALFGSSRHASALQDEWSDIDLLVVIGDEWLADYFPSTAWIEAFGEVYVCEQSSGEFSHVTRCCFRDGWKVDFVFATQASVENSEGWPQSPPWWNGLQVLFSRSNSLRAALERPHHPPVLQLMDSEGLAGMSRSFRFKGVLAIAKIVRNDLLIATHLVLEMEQDCCVLGMVLRDRTYGTNHHRTGGIGNDFIAELQANRFTYTASELLNGIANLIRLFDDLATRYSNAYQSDSIPLIEMLEKARRSLERERP